MPVQSSPDFLMDKIRYTSYIYLNRLVELSHDFVKMLKDEDLGAGFQ